MELPAPPHTPNPPQGARSLTCSTAGASNGGSLSCPPWEQQTGWRQLWESFWRSFRLCGGEEISEGVACRKLPRQEV